MIDVSHGTLVLNSDGSFTYEVGPTFDGTDGFVYRAEFGPVWDEATVILSACQGGPDVLTCWNETAFMTEIMVLGHATFQEGFEDEGVWGHFRTPDSAPSVVSQGIEWRSNHPDPPAMNPISTTSGPPHSGLWAIFDPDHGYATGTPSECDITNPPEYCLYHDGFTGTRQPGSGALHGVGGYLSGTYGANVGILLDGVGPIGGGHLTGGHQFFGVIDARPAGFSRFEFRELDGKVGQAFYVFGDDFSIASEIVDVAQPPEPVAFITRLSPNPAIGGTTINVSLRGPARLGLEVFDASGRLVRSLLDEHRSAGSHAIDWDDRDDAGLVVSSGVYFIRLLATGSGIETMTSQKVVVVHAR